MAYFAPYIDETGIHMPTYEDRLQDLCDKYRAIFGQNAVLDPAVPDYQLLSVFAKALDDTSAYVLSAYNSRNPGYASGQALDLLLPLYGIAREAGESDASVRQRMNAAMASRGIFTFDALEAALRGIAGVSLEAALRGIAGVSHFLIRANDEDSAVDGIPAHTLSVLVQGGNANRIAEAIWRKKPPGIGTDGSLSRVVTDEKGQEHTVKFSRPGMLTVHFNITIKTYDGFLLDAVQPLIRAALMDLMNNKFEIGQELIVPQVYGLLYQAAGSYASTFAITDIVVSGNYGVSRDKVTPAWNQIFTMVSSTEAVIVIDNG